MLIRLLLPDEIPLVWRIDRREHIANVVRARDGELLLDEYDFDVPDWPPGQEESTTPRLRAVLGRGGQAWAAFDGESVVAAVVIDVKPVGVHRDLIQLDWLHVGRDYRGVGLGTKLFDKAIALARELGAAGLYISATPSENTVNFYRARGATLVPIPDLDLFALEPEDIHLEWRA